MYTERDKYCVKRKLRETSFERSDFFKILLLQAARWPRLSHTHTYICKNTAARGKWSLKKKKSLTNRPTFQRFRRKTDNIGCVDSEERKVAIDSVCQYSPPVSTRFTALFFLFFFFLHALLTALAIITTSQSRFYAVLFENCLLKTHLLRRGRFISICPKIVIV